MSQDYPLILSTTENLQYFSGSITFTAATKTLAATGIETGWTVGDTFIVAASVSNNNTFTIATLGTNSLTVNETVVNEGPVVCNMSQLVSSGWVDAKYYSRLVGIYGTSGNAVLYSDWSVDKTNVVVTLSTSITGGTPAAYAQEIVAPYVRIRLKTNAADQTSVACHIYAKAST